MPVVNSVWDAVTQADGGKSVTERHFDQDGSEVTLLTWYAPAGTDIQSVVTARVASLNVQLADQEFEAIIGGS